VNKTIFAGFVALMLVSKITCANAQQFGTAEEARAMLDRAISALETDEDKALTELWRGLSLSDFGNYLSVRGAARRPGLA
jgi:hypothetical protein